MPTRDAETLVDAVPFMKLLEQARSLELETFEMGTGRAVLVFDPATAGLRLPEKMWMPTAVATPDAFDDSENWVYATMLALPVRSTGRAVDSTFITVGRASNNDIILPDKSISAFHAYFQESGGRFFLQDAGSTNATFVNNARVPVQNVGDPVPLAGGEELRFGNVSLSFMLATEVRRRALESS